MSEPAASITLLQPPKAAGAYWLGQPGRSFGFHLLARPSRWHRFWTRVVLGWRWMDNDVP